MAKRASKAAPAAGIPGSRAEAEALMARLGDIVRERTLLATAYSETIDTYTRQRDETDAPLKAEEDAARKRLQAWCEAHRAELTDHGARKWARLGPGQIEWRFTPGKVMLRNVQAVIEALRIAAPDLLRMKTEVNKEAVLQAPDRVANVPGITIEQEELFVITPNAATAAAEMAA